MMERRAFIAGSLGLLAAPLAAEAQPTARAYRVGFITLNPATSGTGPPVLEALRKALTELGYNEGKNLTLEVRFADGRQERLAEFAQELLSRAPTLVRINTGEVAYAKCMNTPG